MIGLAAISILVSTPVYARFASDMPLAQQQAEADLIVVATPAIVKVLDEVSVLPNITSVLLDGTKRPYKAQGVETTFEAIAVIKGRLPRMSFVLHHYRREINKSESESHGQLGEVNGPGFVEFYPTENSSKRQFFLLFLTRAKDGRYVPVNGQVDPDLSVFELKGHIR